jgi:hypothetical protein
VPHGSALLSAERNRVSPYFSGGMKGGNLLLHLSADSLNYPKRNFLGSGMWASIAANILVLVFRIG